MNKMQGFFFGLLASFSFGLIPLFTLPLMEAGYSIPCILFYRSGLAVLALTGILVWKRLPLLASKADSLRLAGLGFLYALSGLAFFFAFHYLDSGIVATIQFSYPIFVVVFMVCFFREKLHVATALAVLMAVAGVAVLSLNGDGGKVSLTGIGLTLLSAALTAMYVTGIQVLRLKSANGLSITLYPLFFGAVNGLVYAVADGSMAVPDRPGDWGYFVLQAVVTCVVSNMALVAAVRRIGPTLTSVLGALDPVTAVTVGVLVFHEAFTWRTCLGVALVVAAVLVVFAPLSRGAAHRLRAFFSRSAA